MVGMRPTRICSLLVAIFTAGLVALAAFSASAKYATLVLDVESGRVLHQINADTRNYPASLTKMMTLYLVFEAIEDGRLTLDQPMAVSARAARQPASKLALRRGQTITVESAILALVTKSANDVATVVAEWLSGTERNFALAMTAKARELGMDRTTFRNASGLPNRGQLSTARDMATLARALLRDFPQYYHYFGVRSFRYAGLRHCNHNKLLGRYDGLDGIKTGYIRASGFNLVASAVRDGRRLIGVVFGGRSPSQRNGHMANLLNKGFAALNPDVRVADAAPAKSPAPTRTSLVEMASSWGIQVGAFRAAKLAQAAAEAAAGRVPTLLEDGFVTVVRTQKGNRKPYYLARIHNISRKEAYRACRILKRAKSRCMELRVKGSVEVVSLPSSKPKASAAARQPATVSPLPTPTAKPKPPVTVATGPAEGPWGIQVGAYRQAEPAHDMALKAQGAARDFLEDGDVAVVRHANGNRRPYFLSRIHGLSAKEARLACRKLERGGIDCLELKLDGATKVAVVDAKPTEASKKADRDRSDAPKRAAWGVQVGAYPKYSPAYERARQAVEIAPDTLSRGEIKVVPLSKGKRRPLYRARIVGISKAQAYRACSVLELRDFDCMELRVSGVQLAAR